MEFNEKLQELRRQRGLTQEELAREIYVSRTAVSKWELGKGYPSIESLKAIAKFFSVTVDELLSTQEVLCLAEQNDKEKKKSLRVLVYGLLDISFLLLLFMPFFASREGEAIQNSSLLMLKGVDTWLWALYLSCVIFTSVIGVLSVVMRYCLAKDIERVTVGLSLVLGASSLLLFIISLQPYAAVIAFLLLAVKALMLILR